MTTRVLEIECVDVCVRITCDNDDLYRVLDKNFEQMRSSGNACQLDYNIQRDVTTSRIIVQRPEHGFCAEATNSGEMIYVLEADLVVQLQLLRPDLLFLHSAVVSKGDSALLITGPSGAGKSTTCWGLINHGYRYLSDELAPVDLDAMSVSPYAHALCMKKPPPAAYPVPDNTLVTERGVHIPPSKMPTMVVSAGLPIGALLFVEYRADADRAKISRIDGAEAAARLYPNVLNALAHSDDGLDAVVGLTRNISCHRVTAADLNDTCDVIERTLAG